MKNSMKLIYFLLFFVVFCIFFTDVSFAKREFTVGVSPAVVNLGEVEAGTTNLVNFFIITPSAETLLVDLQPARGTLDFFNKNLYKDLIFNSSEEDVTPWIKIISNPVELRPTNETLKTAAGLIRGSREIEFLLEIPKNSDPGHHVVSINPIPSTPPGEIGPVGTRVVAITSVSILFNVVGNALRKGVILDTEEGRYVGDRLEIKTYFQNIGTTTISAKAKQKIYDKNGKIINELDSSTDYFKPNEIRSLKTYLPITGLSLGEYDVYTTVDYTTDTVSKNSTISLYQPPTPPTEEKVFIPFWLIILVVILLIAIVIYRRMS